VARLGVTRNAYRILVEKFLLRRPRKRLEDNINTDPRLGDL
jgi:hypothetical protein